MLVEAEIQAAIDDVLPPRAARMLALRLAADPTSQGRVAAGRRQADLLRATFGAIAAEPLPDTLHFAEPPAVGRPAAPLLAAALGSAFLLGAATAWSVHLLLPWL